MKKKTNLFYWFYIEYAHRSIVWKNIFPLHVLDKKENIFNDLSETHWKSQT